MLQDNEGTISTHDQPTGSDMFVSVEMSRSKWVVGIHTPLADKIGLHTMACGDVEALLALIDRARVKLIASGSNSPAAMICYEAGYEGFWLYRHLVALGIRVVVINPASLGAERSSSADRRAGRRAPWATRASALGEGANGSWQPDPLDRRRREQGKLVVGESVVPSRGKHVGSVAERHGENDIIGHAGATQLCENGKFPLRGGRRQSAAKGAAIVGALDRAVRQNGVLARVRPVKPLRDTLPRSRRPLQE